MNYLPRKIKVYFKRKYRILFKDYLNKRDIELLKDTNFVIISDNCWGGAVYQWLDRPYNSPFVGVGFYGDCYIKLLSNFDHYMNQEISFIKESKYPHREITYPLGKLGDIEVHFTHFKDEDEARSKWERRTARMQEETNKDNYYFKICDAWYANEEIFKKFHELPYKNKISFSVNSSEEIKSNAHFKIFERDKKFKTKVPNGVKLFKLTFLYIDIIYWIKNKKIKQSA